MRKIIRIFIGLFLISLLSTGCNRAQVNPAALKSAFGKRVFSLVKNLNNNRPITGLAGIGHAAPRLAEYARSVTNRQFEVREQTLDAFAEKGRVEIVSQRVVFAKGSPPVLVPDRRFLLRWKRGDTGWKVVAEQELK